MESVMKKLLLLLLCVPLIGVGQQTWEKTFGGTGSDAGNSVQQTTDGGFIIAGYTSSFGNGSPDVYLMKTDVNGDSLWAKTYGGADYDFGHSVQQTTDGGFIILGETYAMNAFSSRDVYLIKTDGNGVQQWDQNFDLLGNDVGYSIQQTTDGGYIITGGTSPPISTLVYSDVCLIKTDGNGVQQWVQTYGDTSSIFIPGNLYGSQVQQTTDGGFIIVGGGGGVETLYLIKTDGNGVQQWVQTFLGGTGALGRSVQQTTDGGFIIGGTKFSPPGGTITADFYLIKTDVNGDSLWTVSYGGTGKDFGYSVQQTTDGGYITTGYKEPFSGDYGNVYLIKTDGNGVQQWDQIFGGTGIGDYSEGSQVQQTNDGGYIISGETSSNVQSSDVYVIKTDGNGNVTSEFTIPINPNRELEKVVDILGRDINPEKNKPFIEIYNDGTVEKKIIIE